MDHRLSEIALKSERRDDSFDLRSQSEGDQLRNAEVDARVKRNAEVDPEHLSVLNVKEVILQMSVSDSQDVRGD